jgi:hypothetical protein
MARTRGPEALRATSRIATTVAVTCPSVGSLPQAQVVPLGQAGDGAEVDLELVSGHQSPGRARRSA